MPALRAWFKEIARVAVYLNIPCAYTVAGAMYWGRALRLNDRFLQVNTAQVVPGLGVRIRCDLTIEIDELRRPVSLFGIMNQKKDPPGGSTYKAQLGVRFNKIDEGGSPGLLLEYLSRHQDDPAVVEPGGSPPPGPPAGVEPGGSPAPGPPAGDDGPQK